MASTRTTSPRRSDRRMLAIGSLAALATGSTPLVLALTESPASAASLTVTSLGDGAATPAHCTGPTSTTCTLRDAIAAAGEGDTITFGPTLSGTITLTNGELDLLRSVTIAGPGASRLTVKPGASDTHVFYAQATAGDVTVSGLTIRDAQVTSHNGGAMFMANNGAVTLDAVRLTGNSVSGPGGGAGRFSNTGAVRITNSLIDANSATTWGGAFYFSTNNQAITITDCTFSDNSSTSGGGALDFDARDTVVVISNTTLSGNSVTAGAGGALAFYSGGSLTINQSTIAGNSASTTGAGLSISDGPSGVGTVNLVGTIVSENSASDPARSDIDLVQGASATISSDHSLIGVVASTISVTDVGGTVRSMSPGLAPLTDNGGQVPTRALLSDSPARNAGPLVVPTFIGNLFDARGSGFNRVEGDRVDIGAFEAKTSVTLNTIAPFRLFDTRVGQSGAVLVPNDKIVGPNILEVQVAGSAGLPAAGIAAVSLNVTAVGATANSYLTVYPCGRIPIASNINYAKGTTVAGQVLAPLSNDGKVCFFSMSPIDVIADVNGWLPTGAGFVSTTPTRVFDTRTTRNVLVTLPIQKVAASGTLDIPVLGVGPVPATGVSAVVLNVGAVGASGTGFVKVYPCGSPPSSSSLNYQLNLAVANSVIAPVSNTGHVCLQSSASANLFADVSGWFITGSGYSPIGPTRAVDTRAGQSSAIAVPKAKISSSNVLDVTLTGAAGVPAIGVGAVSLNVTSVGSTAGGFITVYPCGTRPTTSSLNFPAGRAVANAVLAPVSAQGHVCFYSSQPSDLIVDVNGWFAKAE